MTSKSDDKSHDKSCSNCKFLYGDGSGYSNYTWMDTYVRCALERNANLKDNDIDKPYFKGEVEKLFSVWEPIASSRCDAYKPGEFLTLDPDRDCCELIECDDDEQVEAILKHDSGQRDWYVDAVKAKRRKTKE
jgi:hypothetical protein